MPQLIEAKVLCIGIDPGASGGLAEIGIDGVTAVSMPKTELDILEWLRQQGGRSDVTAMIEQVSGYIGEGHPGSAMFKFGMSYGGLRMALIACGIPFETVTPQNWQKVLSIPKRDKKESRTQFKNRLKSKAQQLFPRVQVTLATADALLIAEYCRRKHAQTH